MVGIRRGEGVDVPVLIDLAEHRTRVAGLHVEDELLVHLLLVHLLEGINELSFTHVRVTNANKTLITVINEVDEDGILLSGLEDLGVLNTGQLGDSGLITKEDGLDDFLINRISGVIDVGSAAGSVVLALTIGRISEDLARERIALALVVGGVGHEDDVLGSDAGSSQKIVGTARIGGNGVVRPAIGSTHDHSPLLSHSGGTEQSSNNEKSSHYVETKINYMKHALHFLEIRGTHLKKSLFQRKLFVACWAMTQQEQKYRYFSPFSLGQRLSYGQRHQ